MAKRQRQRVAMTTTTPVRRTSMIVDNEMTSQIAKTTLPTRTMIDVATRRTADKGRHVDDSYFPYYIPNPLERAES